MRPTTSGRAGLPSKRTSPLIPHMAHLPLRHLHLYRNPAELRSRRREQTITRS
jgi:hypothetical protein